MKNCQFGISSENYSDSDLSLGFRTRSYTNMAVQSEKMARGLKFQIFEVEGCYYLCSENKGVDQLTTQLICTFDLAKANSRFSHSTARITYMYVKQI